MNSNKKGKVGERDWRDVVRSYGYDCRRGQQFCGGSDSPDVISEDLSFIHFEVKRTESLSIYVAMAQAKDDCGDKLPVVAHRRNGKEWLCVMEADVFFKLVRHMAFIEKAKKFNE